MSTGHGDCLSTALSVFGNLIETIDFSDAQQKYPLLTDTRLLHCVSQQKKCFVGFNVYTIYEHMLAYHHNRKNKDNIRIAKGLLQLNIQMQQYITMPDIVNKAEMFINLLHSCWTIFIHLVGLYHVKDGNNTI